MVAYVRSYMASCRRDCRKLLKWALILKHPWSCCKCLRLILYTAWNEESKCKLRIWIALYIGIYYYTYVYACYIQGANIICTDSIFVTNQVFILGLRWLKEYCFYNDCNKQNKWIIRTQYFWYMHVLYFTCMCYNGEWHVTRVCPTVTCVYKHGLIPYVVLCLLCTCHECGVCVTSVDHFSCGWFVP